MNQNIQHQVSRHKDEWIESFARIGIVAKGVVYCVLGIIAFMAAFEMGGNNTSSKRGAFRFILEQPYGKVLVALVGLCLLGYVMWRFIQAIKDPENKGTDAKGIATRLGYAFSGLVYLALAYYAATLVFMKLPGGSNGGGGGSGSGDGGGRTFFVSKLLEQPFGQWLVGIVAAGTIGFGLYQFYRAYSGEFKKKLDTTSFDENEREAFDKAGRLGYTSRGIVLCIIGYFFLRAALESDASQARGTSGAFSFIEQSSYGSWLLGLVAIGVICYGVFMFLKAKYQVMDSAK